MQITKQVHALKIPFEVPIAPGRTIARFVYVYLIYGSRVWLIDTGVSSAVPVIINYLAKTGKTVADIAGIALTHSHPDHIGSAKGIQAASGCLIFAHREEKAWIEDAELQERERPVPGFKNFVEGSVNVSRIVKQGNALDLGNDGIVQARFGGIGIARRDG